MAGGGGGGIKVQPCCFIVLLAKKKKKGGEISFLSQGQSSSLSDCSSVAAEMGNVDV